jgi:hypothetical protein
MTGEFDESTDRARSVNTGQGQVAVGSKSRRIARGLRGPAFTPFDLNRIGRANRMRQPVGKNGIRGSVIAAGIVVIVACASQSSGAWSGLYGCYGPPCVVSPLDMPLTPYAMPRRPAWGGSNFRYRIKPSPQTQICGCGWSNDDAAAATQTPYPPEMAASFEPASFERLGHIPRDPLLGPGPAVGPSGR